MIIKYIYIVYYFDGDTGSNWVTDSFHKTYESSKNRKDFLSKTYYLNCMITRQEVIEDWACK